MRIDGGSQNFSRIDGDYVYQARSFRNDPVPPVDVPEAISPGRISYPSEREIFDAEEPVAAVYFPRGNNFHLDQGSMMKGRFLDVYV